MLQAAKTSAPTEVLAGLVERVTFHNPENGFCVLRVRARGQRELITILGHAALIAAGEFVQASGTWVNDRTHGVQFRASFLKAMPPTTTEGIEKYLGSGMIRGIGPVYARKLVLPPPLPRHPPARLTGRGFCYLGAPTADSRSASSAFSSNSAIHNWSCALVTSVRTRGSFSRIC